MSCAARRRLQEEHLADSERGLWLCVLAGPHRRHHHLCHACHYRALAGQALVIAFLPQFFCHNSGNGATAVLLALLPVPGSVVQLCPHVAGVSACTYVHMHAAVLRRKIPFLHLRRKPRRAKLATLLFIELVVQWVNICAFIIPNAYMLGRPCDFFSKIIRALVGRPFQSAP